MDDLTRERYPHGIPFVEARRRPMPLTGFTGTVSSRRVVLCGTDRLDEQEPEDRTHPREVKRQKLTEFLRHWRA